MFEFGYAQEDITPAYGVPLCGYLNPRPNHGALDRLKVKAAIFRTDNQIAGIVSFDLCMVTAPLVKRMEQTLTDAGFPYAEKMVFSATHTHTGPYTSATFGGAVNDSYLEFCTAQMVLAVKTAFGNLAPAELWNTETACSTLSFNRRYVMKNGKTLTNPGKLNPDIVKPEGTIDPKIPVVAVKQEEHLRLIIANISNHADTTGGNLVSADWPGHMEKEIQYQIGEEVPVITLIAPQGNINHFNVKTSADQTSYAEARRIGKGYAACILSSLYSLKKVECSSLFVRTCDIPAPYYSITDEEYAEAKKTFEKYKDATLPAGQDMTSEDIAKGTPYALKFFAEAVLGCRDHAIPGKRIERLRCIGFGQEIGLIALPAEPFVEIGIGLREQSSFKQTIVSALSMGEIGYIGLPQHYGVGGYETIPSNGKADKQVGQAFLNRGSELLAEVFADTKK